MGSGVYKEASSSEEMLTLNRSEAKQSQGPRKSLKELNLRGLRRGSICRRPTSPDRRLPYRRQNHPRRSSSRRKMRKLILNGAKINLQRVQLTSSAEEIEEHTPQRRCIGANGGKPLHGLRLPSIKKSIEAKPVKLRSKAKRMIEEDKVGSPRKLNSSPPQQRPKVNLQGAVRRLSKVVLLRGKPLFPALNEKNIPTVSEAERTTQATEESPQKKLISLMPNREKQVKSPRNAKRKGAQENPEEAKPKNTSVNRNTLVHLVERNIRPTDFLLGYEQPVPNQSKALKTTAEQPKDPESNQKSAKSSKMLLRLAPIVVNACKNC